MVLLWECVREWYQRGRCNEKCARVYCAQIRDRALLPRVPVPVYYVYDSYHMSAVEWSQVGVLHCCVVLSCQYL